MKRVAKEETTGCATCRWKGYLVERKGEYSTAEICKCIKEGCLECKGLGTVLVENRGYTYVNPCRACGVIRRNVKLYNLAGIPAKYSHVLEVNSFRPDNNRSHQKALSYAKDFVKKYPTERGFLLMGRAGLGKTHLAIGTISELTLDYGRKCLFKDFFHLLSELKQAYSQGTSENEVLLPLIETEVLVIDELGKGKSSDWELNILDQLISKRYNASKITLATTNYVTKEYGLKQDQEILEDKIGPRIASRLHEMCEFIHIEGEDHRTVVRKKT